MADQALNEAVSRYLAGETFDASEGTPQHDAINRFREASLAYTRINQVGGTQHPEFFSAQQAKVNLHNAYYDMRRKLHDLGQDISPLMDDPGFIDGLAEALVKELRADNRH